MPALTNRLSKGWITIGGSPGEGGDNEGGTHVFIDDSGKISRGPASLTGRHIGEVDQGKRKPGEKPKPPPPPPKKPSNRLKPDTDKPTQPADTGAAKPTGTTVPPVEPSPDEERPLADRPPSHELTEEPIDAPTPAERPTGQSGGSTTGPEEAGGDVAPAPEGAGSETADPGRQDEGQPAGAEVTGDVPRERVPADLGHVNKRLDRYEQLFRKNGQEKQAEWMSLLKSHINEVGTEAALAELGMEQSSSNRERVVYEGEKAGWESMDDFTHAYLNRHGIVPVHSTGDTADISSLSKKFTEGGPEDGYTTGDLFTPRDPELPNKLEEAKRLPGLESSEDINVVVGKDVTHLSDEVVAKMDEKYGKGQWIVKVYGDDAYAGFGIFFPQRVEALKKEAQDAIWSSGAELSRYGFSHLRDSNGSLVGIQHESTGDKYEFGSREYQTQIYGTAREAADKAEAAAKNEQGPALLDRNGNVSGKEFMVQPAFAAVGISDEERARGVTGAEGGKGEGRVHVVTRDGRAELVPHSTWIKGQWMPVVFESEETRQMAQAAVDAINALPESERQGQIYAPDVMRSEQGYRVIEANPANNTGSSGYLGDNPFIIDSYVSHILGQEPQHTKFIRDLLSSRKKGGGKKSLLKSSPIYVTKGGRVKQQQSPIAAGLAVVAADTGRVLMVQRPLEGGDPNGGKWEFPGGTIDENEKPLDTAFREWSEETGLPIRGGLDASMVIDAYGNRWTSADGKYVGFVAHIPSEDTFDLSQRDWFSDPDSEVGAVVAWVHPRDLPQHNLRPALLSDVDQVVAAVSKWLLRQVRKTAPTNRLVTKDKGTCKPGQTAAQTDCTPAGGGGAGSHNSGTVQSAGRWLAGKWQQLEERYGRRAALAMAVAMLGTLPVPGNVAAVIAVAEGIRGVGGYFQRECSGDVEKLKSCCAFPTNRLRKGNRRQTKTSWVMTVRAHVGSLSTQALDRARMLYGPPDSNNMITTQRLVIEAANYQEAEDEFARLWPHLSGVITRKSVVVKASSDQVLAAMNQLGNGRDKFTALSALGRHLGGSPESLHAAVMQLWRAGKITVAKPEGRHGSTPEERRWWLEAQGETLGYVMLRS